MIIEIGVYPWCFRVGNPRRVPCASALPIINMALLKASRVSFLATFCSRAPPSDNPSEYGTGCFSVCAAPVSSVGMVSFGYESPRIRLSSFSESASKVLLGEYIFIYLLDG